MYPKSRKRLAMVAYLSGNGVEENDEIAMEWFEKAAENGNEKALKITGRRKR